MSSNVRYIGYWMSKKKSQKFDWVQFKNICKSFDFELIKVDIEDNIEDINISIFLHKLTDVLVSANQGDNKSLEMMNRIKNFLNKNSDIIIIDPIDKLQCLLDRYKTYSLIANDDELKRFQIFTPNFCILTNNSDQNFNYDLMKTHGVKFPIVSKPIVSHSKQAHQMSIIFNINNLKDIKSNCVAQTFVNHNAKLYKIFIVKDRFYVVERPSIKNFYDDNSDTIFFDSQDISKSDSQHTLSVLDIDDIMSQNIRHEPDVSRFRLIAKCVRKKTGMCLLGVDVVIENETENYFIIDINAFPGYDGYPNFYEDLVISIKELLDSKSYSNNINKAFQIQSNNKLLNTKHFIGILE